MKSYSYLRGYWQLMGVEEGCISLSKLYGHWQATYVLVDSPTP